MNAPIFYLLNNPVSHALVVVDNHYGTRFNQQTPCFMIDDTSNIETFACRIIDNNLTPPVPGLHYIVNHTHAYIPLASNNLEEFYQKVCWDIIIFKRILFEIPLQYQNAISILSKEISMDKTLKKYIENRMRVSNIAFKSIPKLSIPPQPAQNLTMVEYHTRPLSPSAPLCLQTSPAPNIPPDDTNETAEITAPVPISPNLSPLPPIFPNIIDDSSYPS